MSATESVENYVKRLKGLGQGADSMETLRSTPEKIAHLTRDVRNERLITPPGPHKWSISQIVAHLADAEMVIGFRLRQILSLPDGTPIPSYNQDAWASICHYETIPLIESLDLFSALRRSSLRLWESLSPEQLLKFGSHSERGRESVQDLLALTTGHDINHLGQIQAIVSI